MPKSAEKALYLDASALVKLVVPEAETAELTAFVEHNVVLTSCSLARVEVLLAARPHGADAIATARALIAKLDLIQLDDELLNLAGDLEGPLRSLDAVHVAAAMELGEGLDAFVTYDRQMTRAAESLGLPIAAPG